MAYQTPADDAGAPPSSRTLDPIANAWRDADPLMAAQTVSLGIGLSEALPAAPALSFGA